MSFGWLKSALSASLSIAALMTGVIPVQAVEFEMPRLLVIGTPGTSSGSFASSNGWAPALQRDLGLYVRVVPEDSEFQRHRRLTQRRDLAVSSVSTAELRSQTEGVDHYATLPPAAQRILWHHNDTPWTFVVSGDSDLHTMEDLAKRPLRVAQGQFSPTMMGAVREGLPAWLNMSPEETDAHFTFVPASSYVENCRSVVEGRADVAYCASVSSVMAEMEGAPGGIRWLSMDLDNTEAWDRFLGRRPMAVPTEIAMGVASARGVDGLASNFLYVVTADTEEEFAYSLAKWFHQAYDRYRGSHPLSSRMSLKVFREYLDRSPLPVHEGTIRYLREVGAWTDEDDAWNREAIERMDRWIAARQAALEEARQNGIAPNARDDRFMAIMNRHTEGLDGFRTRL
jgi:TRAP-type uncharacterized transport system substrate-binding protein